MQRVLDPNSVSDYAIFIRAKSLPQFRCRGRMIEVPDEYAHLLDSAAAAPETPTTYKPIKGLFDYQEAVARLAIRKKKYAIFLECGLGKSLIETEFAKHAAKVLPKSKCVLMLAPPMVVKQTLGEIDRFYGNSLKVDRIEAKDLAHWLTSGKGRIGITNYEALKDTTPQGRLGALICDESSVGKSAYGTWFGICIRLGQGLEWKLCGTGTPAPNDRIEYGNHAVFLDAFPTINAFYAKYFVNRGQTDNRWELKPHALKPFYRDLSAWCVFLNNPATYGFKDNCGTIPPIEIHIHDIDMTDDQREAAYQVTGTLFLDAPGGIVKRAKLSRIGKGEHEGRKLATAKNDYIKGMVDSWPNESTLIWCEWNSEQDQMERLFPDAASIAGKTPIEERERLLADFQAGRTKVMISKAVVLGYGLNLQIATRQVFSGLRDSWEKFHQCVKRSNRIGSTMPLHVHIPVTELERPGVATVLKKANRIEADTEEQERLFKETGVIQW